MVFFKREANNCKVLTKCWKDGGTKCAGYAKGFRGASDRQSYVETVVIWNKKRSDGQCDLILQNLKQYKFIGNKKEP